MFSSLKKTLLASLGAVAFTRDRLQQAIDDLVARGAITREQGKKVFENLIARGEEESEELSRRILGEVQGWKELFPVTRRDFHKLIERVERLEAGTGIGGMAAGGETGGASAPSPASLPQEHPGEALPPSPAREGAP